MPSLTRTATTGAEASSFDQARNSSFSLILSAEPTDEQAERLYARRGDVTLGVRSGVPYAAFDRVARSLPEAVDSALRDIEVTMPQIQVVRVEPDELVNAADIARRTSRTRANVSQLIEGLRGPGRFPTPRSAIGQRPLWDWLDVATWFASHYSTGTADVRSAAFLSALNGALCIRRLAPHLTGDEERRALAHLIQQDAELLGLKPHTVQFSPAQDWHVKEEKAMAARSKAGAGGSVTRSTSPTRRIVAPHPEGGWTVAAPAARRASVRTATQREAEVRAKEIVRNLGGGEVQVRGRDGRIRDSDTVPPGKDPNPPRDRRH